jgi:hypothetical protein
MPTTTRSLEQWIRNPCVVAHLHGLRCTRLALEFVCDLNVVDPKEVSLFQSESVDVFDGLKLVRGELLGLQMVALQGDTVV